MLSVEELAFCKRSNITFCDWAPYNIALHTVLAYNALYCPVSCYVIGTFAVVSLMVGQVVEKADCYGPQSSSVNETDEMLDVFDDDNFTVSSDDGRFTEDTARCQLGAAVAVTFVVGIYQVIYDICVLLQTSSLMSSDICCLLTDGPVVQLHILLMTNFLLVLIQLIKAVQSVKKTV
jgi:hypothetical protein